MEVRVRISPRFQTKFNEETSIPDESGLPFDSSEIEIYVPLTIEEKLKKENIVLKRLQAGLEDSRSEYLTTELENLQSLLQHETKPYLCQVEYDELLKCLTENPEDFHQKCQKQKNIFFECSERTMTVHFQDDDDDDKKEDDV